MERNAEETSNTSLWEYVSIDQYRPPEEPVTQTVRKGIRFLRRLFELEKKEDESPLKKEEELQKLPDWQLEKVVPSPDWGEAAESLKIELQAWLDNGETNHPVIVLVGPPFSGHAEILQAWAAQHAWRVLEPPSAEQILAGEVSWLSEQQNNDGPWVFPVLERAYLRHLSGLGMVRNFLNQAFAGSLGRGIIGCGSWAWVFLRQVWQGRPPVVLTTQAFDEDRLETLLKRLARRERGEQLLFRQSSNGEYVLPAPEVNGNERKNSSFLKSLAAHSRGIPGVALGIWRDNLEAEPREEMPEEKKNEDRQLPFETVWVNPWKKRRESALPDGASHDEAFVLQALLLHNDLPFELLRHILPISTNRAMETVFFLEKAGLVEQKNGVWRVSPAGYPAARRLLKNKGYFVDQF